MRHDRVRETSAFYERAALCPSFGGRPFDTSTYDVVKHVDPWNKNSWEKSNDNGIHSKTLLLRIESAAKSRRDGTFMSRKLF